ncbi:MAG: PTS sugar transporter subunit IIA [Deltaproteobacteria bacterium]|nr:PTS sugar transporter subunit IIA [Deltaproteobacteria bacterium]
MVGGVIITHGDLATALLNSADAIAGDIERVLTVCVEGSESTEEIAAMIEDALSRLSREDGIVIFTDMFGGTPTNIALTFLDGSGEDRGGVEVLTGVNLPLILKFLNNRRDSDFKELISQLTEYGRKSIVLASEMLKGGAI